MVSLSQYDAVVAAIRHDAEEQDVGALYVFNFATGKLLQPIENPVSTNGGQFGSHVASSGNYILVGIPAVWAEDSGAAELFKIIR